MEHDLHFDVAFSYASSDSWIAKDLYNLIAQSGLSIYCYDCQSDSVAGFLRSNLLKVYRDSRMNLILWSRTYASADKDSFPAMERRCLIHRHVEKGDSESLFLLSIDDAPFSPEIEPVLAHNIRQHGLFGTSRLIIERIRRLSASSTALGLTQHPIGTEKDRGQMYPCEFRINQNYQKDLRGRWRNLADVLVDFSSNPLGTKDVYLIPSGSCSPLLRHSEILRTQPDLLDHKRKATEKFVQKSDQEHLTGFWFALRSREIDVATIYAPKYDMWLNASLLEWTGHQTNDAGLKFLSNVV